MASQLRIVRLGYARHFLTGSETYFIAPTAWYYIKSLGQNELFLAFVLSAYNVAAIVAGPLFGRIVDRYGRPRLFFLVSCIMKVIAYILYTINVSAYFPLVGRFLSGLSDGGIAVIFGQIAIQTDVEVRGSIFVFLEGVYCLGATFGPGVGSFATFDVNIFGWHIDQGNSPGIVLTIVWTLFLVISILLPKDMWVATGTNEKELVSVSKDGERSLTEHDSDDRTLTENHSKEDRLLAKKDPGGSQMFTKDPESGRRTLADYDLEGEPKIDCNFRVLCLFYLIFWNEVLSSTSTFYVPVLAMNHFHLQLIHVKLLFLNCTVFTLLIFILFSLASAHFDERRLFLVAMAMQISAIALLMTIGYLWDNISVIQNYVLLLYICFGMPYFAFPFSNSILSKITDPRNASFYQGSAYSSLHSAIFISRVVISFVFTKESLIAYSSVLAFFWFVGLIWFSIHYKHFGSSEGKKK